MELCHKWNTSGKVALIIGNEGKGISSNIKKADDDHYSMNGHVQSLNASVAAAILMYEVFRTGISNQMIGNFFNCVQ